MATATLVTSEEFLALPDEFDPSGNRIKEELIAGEVVKMPTPSRRHDVRKNRIARILGRYLDNSPQLGLDVLVEIAYKVSQYDTLTPDVSVIRTERLYAGESRLTEGAPDIAIEVISPTDTASGIKRKIKAYLENGAASVWIFYDDGSVMSHSASQVRELQGEQKLEDPMLPGFSISVTSFFAPA
jgi:Uma2 family endonuclease